MALGPSGQGHLSGNHNMCECRFANTTLAVLAASPPTLSSGRPGGSPHGAGHLRDQPVVAADWRDTERTQQR